MQISDEQTDLKSLADIGSAAVRLLCSGDYVALGAQFGYALAFGRNPATAIGEELALCLKELGASALGHPPTQPPAVSYFNTNDAGLYALVEQRVPTDSSGHVLLELIVSSRGSNKHVVLEQLSAAA